jgi:hypothetical protein
MTAINQLTIEGRQWLADHWDEQATTQPPVIALRAAEAVCAVEGTRLGPGTRQPVIQALDGVVRIELLCAAFTELDDLMDLRTPETLAAQAAFMATEVEAGFPALRGGLHSPGALMASVSRCLAHFLVNRPGGLLEDALALARGAGAIDAP